MHAYDLDDDDDTDMRLAGYTPEMREYARALRSNAPLLDDDDDDEEDDC